ncbi:Gfo/Idh/MocA family oxidoreductase [Pontibacter sp. G13]|uniref:Gfo/Idh/MocA family protein n=1 Tax=Pontibacter sp. G13 TaxID=3074898 RepID=UPI00288B86E8|nr:Gfo/Idh/MocA family oxidoreductase [Pontibacter sp. G13]WNJ17857.1 Gfo/Idh/MocA family oxidoreductase [Pontibacter sp. G13]
MSIRIACIGAGYFARFHLDAWNRIPEVEVVAICDRDLEKAQALASEFGIPHISGSVEKLCRQVDFDVADIITPPETHLTLSTMLAQAGKHIICQKPLVPTLEDVRKLIRVIEQTGVRFMVHENFRFQPWYRIMKQLWRSGVVGNQIHRITQHMRMGDGWGQDAYLNRQPYFRTMPRMLVHETGVHFIDVFRYLGGEITSVYARLSTLNSAIAGEDSGLILFDLASGGEAVWDANRYNESAHPNPRYTFGTTTLEANGGTIRLALDGGIEVHPLGHAPYEFDYLHEDRGFAGDCVYFTQRHFVAQYLNKVPFEHEIWDYLHNLLVQEAVYQSHVERREVAVQDTLDWIKGIRTSQEPIR